MSYDLIVIGTGGVGSSALFHAAEQGLKTLGLDRFPPGHDRGSSHGESRMIRQSYFEHPDYVPLLRLSYRKWDELVARTGRDLFHRTGLLYFGSPDGDVVKGVLASADRNNIAVEELTEKEATSRYPGFQAGEGQVAVFEPDAGYLRVEDCVVGYIDEAVQLGAEHRYGETVLEWNENGEGFEVVTDRETYLSERLIITAGAWTNSLLGYLGIRLQPLKKHLHWYEAPSEIYGEMEGCPCYAFDLGDSLFYGMPVISPNGLKVAEHSGGTETGDPLQDLREPEQEDTDRVESFLKNHLPRVTSRRLLHKVCFYTMSPDGDYIVDRLPGNDSAAFAAGLSGHGFKSASALGDTLVRMVTGRKLEADIDFLGLKRFEKS